MKRVKQIGRALFIALCLCYIFNMGGAQEALVHACYAPIEGGGDAPCTTRSGGNHICDCVGEQCGKVCSRSISLNCEGGTCKTPPSGDF
jgi:hypothetical protein